MLQSHLTTNDIVRILCRRRENRNSKKNLKKHGDIHLCEVESFQCSSYTIVYFPMGNFGILPEKVFNAMQDTTTGTFR